MKFNQYIWSLYKQSSEGKKVMNFFLKTDGYTLFKKYCPHASFVQEDFYNDWLDNIYCYGVSDSEQPISLNEAKEFYILLITQGIRIEDSQWLARDDSKQMLGYIQPISYILSRFSPDYFFPYLFLCRIFDLNRIADAFDIVLPKLPKRVDYYARCMYYWELCEVFYRFREENGLSPIELCAFLYDFALNYIGKEKLNIPQPAQAWLIGGLLYPEDTALDVKFWQSSQETKRGDILVHYETSPTSAISCVEIAQTDGVVDPLFRFYSNTYIGNRIEIPHITLKELQMDEYFSKYPLVKKNFQGVNGYPVSNEDYLELLRMVKGKGFNIDVLPKLYAPTLPKNLSIKKEEDVERQLLEPLLNSMGWYKNKDFIRQLGIKAGRGHRIFPDYTLHYDNKPGEEKAKVLIEAKLHMKNNQAIEDAFLQAKSYAQLLESSVIVLCDKYYLLVYEKRQSFERNNYKRYTWLDMENPDLFNEFKNKLNK